MPYLLDTNAWIHHLNHADSPVTRQLAQRPAADIRLCSVVEAELIYGAYKSQRIESNLAVLKRLFSGLTSHSFDRIAAEQFGSLRAELARVGQPIGPLDLQIASIALAHGCTVVTHNTREFSRIEALQIEDWQSPA